MDRVFLAQPLEVRPEGVVAEKLGMTDVEIIKRRRIGALARFFPSD